jgi:hypothetical protein
MLLPGPLFSLIEPHLDHHHCWHLARQPAQGDLRAMFPGEGGEPRLHGINEAGSGKDFLLFHRRMLQHFFWMLQQPPGVPSFRFGRWTDRRLPAWVEDLIAKCFPEFQLMVAYQRIEALIHQDSLDELGAYLEPNAIHKNEPGAGLHFLVHSAIGKFERSLYPCDVTAPMDSMGLAPGNIFFWPLHGWIDDRFADWQSAHGIAVERPPQELDHEHMDAPCQRPLLVPCTP